MNFMRKQGQEGKKKKKEQALESKTVDATMAVQTVGKQDYFIWQCCENNIAAERQLYTALRGAVPIIDSAIHKLLRIIGNFTVECEDKQAEKELHFFLNHVKVNTYQQGIYSFISCYFDQLLTYGTAVAEIVPTIGGNDIGALYVADLDNIDLMHNDKTLSVDI